MPLLFAVNPAAKPETNELTAKITRLKYSKNSSVKTLLFKNKKQTNEIIKKQQVIPAKMPKIIGFKDKPDLEVLLIFPPKFILKTIYFLFYNL